MTRLGGRTHLKFETKIAVAPRQDLVIWRKLNGTAASAAGRNLGLAVLTEELVATRPDAANRAAVKARGASNGYGRGACGNAVSISARFRGANGFTKRTPSSVRPS